MAMRTASEAWQGLLVEVDRSHRGEVRPGAHAGGYRDVGVVVGDLGAEAQEVIDELEGGTLSGIVDVFLVGQAEDEDLGILERSALLVEREHELLDRRTPACGR